MAGLDVFLLGIVLFFMIIGYARGFVKTVMGFIANIIILLLTYHLTPALSAFLQKTSIFDTVKSVVANSLKLEERIGDYISQAIANALFGVNWKIVDWAPVAVEESRLEEITANGLDLNGLDLNGLDLNGLDLENINLEDIGLQNADIPDTVLQNVDPKNIALPDIDLQNIDLQSATQAIQGMELPQFFKEALITNNNPVIYKTLNANGFIDYIYGYITNIAINAMAAILLFIGLSILIHTAVRMLNLVAKLPVISTFNRLGGLLFGFFEGIIFVWIAVVCITLLAAIPVGGVNLYFSSMLGESVISKLFTNTGTNILLDMVLTMSQR